MITNKEKNFISVVIYVRNLEGEIYSILSLVHTTLEKYFDKFEIICVNDASEDNSRKEIERFSQEVISSILSVVNMSSFQGKELSMNAGTDLAIGDFIYEFDSMVFDYDETLIMNAYYKSLEGYDIVSVVPESTSGFTSKLFYKIFNRYSFAENTIQQESFRILSRRAFNRAKSLNRALAYRKAVYASCGLSAAVIPYRNTGKGRKIEKEERTNRTETAMDSLILFTNVVQKFSLYISLLFLAITVTIGLYTWGVYFSDRKPVEGWTPLMLFLSLGFFGIFLILTVTLQYLSVVLRLIFKKRQYLIESIEKMTNN